MNVKGDLAAAQIIIIAYARRLAKDRRLGVLGLLPVAQPFLAYYFDISWSTMSNEELEGMQLIDLWKKEDFA